MTDPLDRLERRRKAVIGPPGVGGARHPDSVDETEEGRFQEVLRGITGGPAEKRLGKLLEEIGDLSSTLARRRLLEDLEDFRAKVGEFLRVYLDEVLTVREAAGSARGLRNKQMVVVKRVGVELEELRRMVLGGEPEFKIVGELETIQGLLMDLYR